MLLAELLGELIEREEAARLVRNDWQVLDEAV